MTVRSRVQTWASSPHRPMWTQMLCYHYMNRRATRLHIAPPLHPHTRRRWLEIAKEHNRYE